MAETLLATGREAILIYANRDSGSAVFMQELEDLAARSGGRLTLLPVMSGEPAWTGEKGRVDRALLERLVPDLTSRDVFLCGPPLMMRSVRSALMGLGVAAAHIHDECFSL